MSLKEAEIHHLLYEDEEGEVIGLDEVQLLDPAPLERIPFLLRLMSSDDIYLIFQSAIILAAWGNEQGLAKVEELIDIQVHKIYEISPHRIENYDNVYDDLAYAVHLYGLTGKDFFAQQRIFKKLLNIYGYCHFQSLLKLSLLKSECPEIIQDVQAAIERSLKNGYEYLASQLLPVLAKWQPEIAWLYVEKFMSFPKQTPDPIANVAEALKYIHTNESLTILKQLRKHDDYAVSEEATKSLSSFSKIS